MYIVHSRKPTDNEMPTIHMLWAKIVHVSPKYFPTCCASTLGHTFHRTILTLQNISHSKTTWSNSFQSRAALVLYVLALHTLLFAIIYAYHACILMHSLLLRIQDSDGPASERSTNSSLDEGRPAMVHQVQFHISSKSENIWDILSNHICFEMDPYVSWVCL